jgi:hypothetical protein
MHDKGGTPISTANMNIIDKYIAKAKTKGGENTGDGSMI